MWMLTSALKIELTKGMEESNNALKTKLTKKIDESNEALERKLSTSIAAREVNGLTRTLNNKTSQSGFKLRPFYSVLTNTPIANFPTSVSTFKALSNQKVTQVLRELDGPFHKPNYGTSDEKRQRLAFLIGVRLSDDPVMLRPTANASNAGDDSDDRYLA
ncbi:hypothetical protein GGR51DRAFT_564032 [Nemania sp. FL0031]|nr:hypothetical protein GGR51DRAFT_564032 [Nemania sp. FL0031]